MEKIDILSLDLYELELKMLEIGEKKFRAKQIFQWIHIKKVFDFNEMTDISVQLREKLNDVFCLKSLFVFKKLESSIDNTVKYLYRLSDGNFVETVLMEYHHGLSVCVSTQVGCKMGCKFCASAIAGFVRNLTPSEILMQVYQTEKDFGKKISSIVLMGIGEPLDNYDNVLKFMELISHKNGNNLSLRHLALSTCGVVPQIYKLADEKFGLTLSISLHSADDKSRSDIMPINNAYNIDKLIDACKHYISVTGRRVTFEYAVIHGVNDSYSDAEKLTSLLKGINCHINLIPINKVKERNYKSIRSEVEKFAQLLSKKGLNATVRRTLGSDIDAACGQLRRDTLKNTN